MSPSPRLRTVEAVIISHKDYGEADRFVTLFSREAGKVRGLAKGIRKAHSRKAAYLEPFMHSKVVLARGKSLWIITQADAVHQYMALRDDLSKTAAASYLMELADRFSIEEEPLPPLFRLLTASLKRINDREDLINILRYYELKLLEHTGFRPDLTDCVGCGKPITARDQFFSSASGGVLCPECGSMHTGARRASVEALRYLRHFQRSTFEHVEGVRIPPAVRDEIAALMTYYISAIVERKLHSPDFMRRVNGSPDGRVK